jgi:hypothetical protein
MSCELRGSGYELQIAGLKVWKKIPRIITEQHGVLINQVIWKEQVLLDVGAAWGLEAKKTIEYIPPAP